MLLKQFYDTRLAQASYLFGCAATGEAIVVDPHRDIELYLEAARTEKLRITHVTETHIHADYLSGSRELARAAGATLLLSDEGTADWRYGFARADGATLLHDGDTFMVGNIRFTVMHTPGHTPEHLSFLVTDTAATEVPMGIVTGDFLFVGDVGRPDLLEKAAKVVGTMEAGARQLYASLRKLAPLPDHLQVWPGHGAGSACGKSLGAVPQSTLGYERAVNWAFGHDTEEGFVRAVLEGQPEPPVYFATMKRLNRDGPPFLAEAPEAVALAPDALTGVIDRGVHVVDVRSADQFAEAHVPRTLNLPLTRSFTTWAGWLLPYDADLVLLAPGERAFREARRELRMIGLDRVTGWLDADAVLEWARSGHALQTVTQMTVDELARVHGEDGGAVLDVRNRSEYEAGHIPGVPNIPLGELASRLDEVPEGRPLVLHCQGGGRSAIAASLLQAHGIADVINLRGGFGAWRDGGHPVEQDAPAAAAR